MPLQNFLKRPLMACLVICVAGGALLFPGLGGPGLSDPWEMRLAHSALGLLDTPVVQVLEPSVKNDEGKQQFVSTEELAAQFEGQVQVIGPAEMRVRSSSTLGKRRMRRMSH